MINRVVFAQDRNGRDIQAGVIVLHKSVLHAPGYFRVEWDNSKLGYVLVGIGDQSDGWIRDWCPSNTVVQVMAGS